MRESDIKFEGKGFWVLGERKAYTVCRYNGTHSLTIQSFAKTEDGLSLAIAYAKYKDSLIASQPKAIHKIKRIREDFSNETHNETRESGLQRLWAQDQ